MHKDAIIDFETLGVGHDGLYFVVTDCALLTFDIEGEDTFDELVERCNYFKFNLSEQKKILNWHMEQGAIDFWKSQPKELQQKLVPSSEDVKLREFIENVVVILTNSGVKRMWCRGMNFDVPILQRIFQARKYNIDDHIHYSQYNDIRTYIRAFIGLDERDDFIPETAKDAEFVKHNSKHDVAMDAMRLQYINNQT